MNAEKAIEIIKKFRSSNILVIGDIMLDKYVWGDVNRTSQEAPVQIVKVNAETFIAGGAANVANNIIEMGSKVTLVGLAGDDIHQKILMNDLRKSGVDISGMIIDKNRPTTTKTRIMSQNQQLLRVDYESDKKAEDSLYNSIFDFLKSKIDSFDLVAVSDYSKGLITKNFFDYLKELCDKRSKKIIVDPKPENMKWYAGAFLLTPNHIEASKFTGMNKSEDNESILKIGAKIQEGLDTNVLITRGSKGMTLFEKGRDPFDIPTQTKEVYDVTGAGDTVLAALAVSVAGGSDLRTASLISNHAAGIVISKRGTATANQKELLNIFDNSNKKIKNIDELKKIAKELKVKGRKIVWTNGCFDILHSGHTRYLQEAKKLGDVLILGLNTDASIKRIKGKNRPIISQNERAEIVSALECVDYILFFDEDTPIKHISALLPDIIVKGGDYKKEDIVGKDIVEGYNGEVIIMPLKGSLSTTKIIEDILKKHSS